MYGRCAHAFTTQPYCISRPFREPCRGSASTIRAQQCAGNGLSSLLPHDEQKGTSSLVSSQTASGRVREAYGKHVSNGSVVTREGDVHVGDHMKIAWFKDPDGNILNVVSR